MKKIKKFLSLLAAAAVMATVSGANVMEAEAAAPTTFYIKFDKDENEWRTQSGEWRDDREGRSLYYLNNSDEKVNDGDIVVILANEDGSTGSEHIQIDAHLSNLTVNRSNAVVSANGIDECYVLGDSYAAITGNITNAYVYDNAACTFHSNVTNLRLIATKTNDIESTVTVGGTVAYASTANDGGVLDEYYNFVADTFHFDPDSGLMTDQANYTTAGSGPASAPAAPAQGNNTPAQGNNTPSGDYDDVPKTGESNPVIWLFVISAICFAGSVALRKAQ